VLVLVTPELSVDPSDPSKKMLTKTNVSGAGIEKVDEMNP
jgi:hypothetical protein